MTMTTSSSLANIIPDLLREKNIRVIAIIDDAYDKLQKGELAPAEISAFWDRMELDDQDAHEELLRLAATEFNAELTGPEDISDEILSHLFEHRQEFKALRMQVEKLFHEKLGKIAALERFCSPVETKFKLEVRRLGRDFDIDKDLEGVSIVLIDYRMGPDDQESSIARANDVARAINKRYTGKSLPLIVLVSAQPGVEQHKEEFRKKSDLINGMFLFTPKDELGDSRRLPITLGTWAKTLGAGSELASFVNTLKTSIHDAADEFIDGIKNLSLSDYAYIQKFSLQNEGHPLGDYMLWLFNAYLGRLVLESPTAIKDRQKIVDKLIFERLPPTQAKPSNQLIDMYESALFDANVGDATQHPWVSKEKHDPAEQESGEGVAPYLHLGHLFVRDDKSEVLMVISADCDLAHTPGGKRVCDLNGSVMVIPGTLHLLHKGEGLANQPRTEFFKYKERHYRILWDVKRGQSYRFGEILRRLHLYEYKLEARLRLPYALEVQRAYAANLTRVGMPVAPPIYQPVRVQVLTRGEDKKARSLLDPDGDVAFLISIKDPNKVDRYQMLCFFTASFAHRLREAITDLVKGVQQNASDLDKSDPEYKTKFDRLKKRIDKATSFLDDLDGWFLTLDFCVVPLEGKIVKLEHEAVGVCRNRSTEDEYNVEYIALINLIDN